MFSDKVIERFWKNVKRDVRTGCLEWQKSCSGNGYGQLWTGQSNNSAHTVAYSIHYGEIPDGMMVRHKCDNRKCANPDHLELGTNKQNMEDRSNRGHDKIVTYGGEQHFNAQLTDDDVIKMREMAGMGRTALDISKKFNVSLSAASRAISGHTWSHLPGAIALKNGATNTNRHKEFVKRSSDTLVSGKKKCRQCWEEKILDEFTKRAKSLDGRDGRCKSCNRENAKKYYKK